jgi:hypothetical protein
MLGSPTELMEVACGRAPGAELIALQHVASGSLTVKVPLTGHRVVIAGLVLSTAGNDTLASVFSFTDGLKTVSFDYNGPEPDFVGLPAHVVFGIGLTVTTYLNYYGGGGTRRRLLAFVYQKGDRT